MRRGFEKHALRGQRLIRAIIALAALPWFVVATVDAQSRRWYGPYKAGLEAIDSGEWNVAITSLRIAASIESKCESSKVIEGVIRDDYCPDIYLAKAYIGSRQFAEAEQILRSTQNLPRVFSRMAEELRAQLMIGQTAAQFDAARDEALAALKRGEFNTALRQLHALRSSNLSAFVTAGLDGRVNEATAGLAGELAREGQALLQKSRLLAARVKFVEADSQVPGFEPAQRGLAEIVRREAEYEEHKAAASLALATKKFDLALTELDLARKAHLEKYRADGLRLHLIEAATGSASQQPKESAKEYGLARIRCDSACSVSIGAGPVWTIEAGDSQLVPVKPGTHAVVAYTAPRKALWRSLVDVRSGQTSEVAVPVRAESARLASMKQQEQRVRTQLDSTRARTALIRAEKERLLAESNAARVRDEQKRTAIQTVVQKITTLEAQIDSELKQAEKEEQDAATAETNAGNSLLGTSGFGRFLQGANAVGSVALKISAERRRRRAQEMLVEINRLTQELYRATVQER